MSRNSSGIYALPFSLFVANTAIVAAPVNGDLDDIADSLTDSVSLSGVSDMTGSLKAFDGSPTNPSYKFENSQGLGFYINPTESGVAWVVASVSAVLFTSVAATTSLAAYWAGQQIFNGLVAFRGGITFINGINATVTITGDLTITKGLRVGFTGAADDDRIAVGDNNFYLELNEVTADEFQAIINYDSGDDNIVYDRENQLYEFTIGGTIYKSMEPVEAEDSEILLNNYVYLPEISASVSVGEDNVVIFARDNGIGTTRLYYTDGAGNETPMGGQGSWEEITSIETTTSVTSVVISLTKLYSRLTVCGVQINATASTSRSIIVEVSDDGGSTYETAERGGFGGPNGSVLGLVGSATSSPMRDTTLSALNDFSFFIDFFDTDKASLPKTFSGQASSFTNLRGFFGAGQTAVCDEIDAIRIRWSDGSLIGDDSFFTVYGELAL